LLLRVRSDVLRMLLLLGSSKMVGDPGRNSSSFDLFMSLTGHGLYFWCECGGSDSVYQTLSMCGYKRCHLVDCHHQHRIMAWSFPTRAAKGLQSLHCLCSRNAGLEVSLRRGDSKHPHLFGAAAYHISPSRPQKSRPSNPSW
jgi:hypothetical protein